MIKDTKAENATIKANDMVFRKLHADFPNCFNKEGKFDLEKFQSLISDKVDITKEGYDLNFLGKNYANLIASTETETVIQPDIEHNSKPENKDSQNIYISGDNLDALKHLLKSYSGKIKCIYIDPPYNTGSDGFVYNDKFNFTPEQLQTKLGVDEDKAKRILDLCKRGSASHSAWLMFMAPRLMLAKDLLTEDGVIFISIDDNEQANLKLLCDGVFGEENFICDFIWKSKSGGANDSKYAAIDHEYVICYGIDVQNVQTFMDKDAIVSTSYNLKDENGEYALDRLDKQSIRYSQSLDYEIVDKDGNIYTPQHKDKNHPNATWRWGKDTVKERFNELVFKNGCVYTKNYKKDAAIFRSLLIDERFGRTRTGKTDFAELFETPCFSSPKPIKLIQILSSVITSKSDIILDFFSGSATTAHAVMKLNAEDGGNRKYIMVQLPEQTPADSEARKAGYETIDQIGQERIRRAAAKIKAENPNANIDFGFKHYTLQDVPQNTLDKMETFNPNGMFGEKDILESFGTETVLATWMEKDGYGLTQNATELKLANYTAYYYGGHIYMIDGEGFDEKAMIALVDKYGKEADFNPRNVVLFGYSFTYTQIEMLKKNLSAVKKLNESINIDIRY